MLGDILSKEDFSRPVFIFHGTEEHVNQLFQECEAIAGMFAEYNTFRISLSTEMPPITLNDTEFQPALRETPFAEFSAEEESRNRKNNGSQTDRENVSSDGTLVERAYSGNLPYEPGR